MAYQRPQQSNNSGSGRPAQGGFKGKSSGFKSGSEGGGGGKGNKPKFRLAVVEKDGEGKFRTVKGEDGKTVYVGAAWENKFDGLNIKIEEDIAAGTQVRAYPVEDKPQS